MVSGDKINYRTDLQIHIMTIPKMTNLTFICSNSFSIRTEQGTGAASFVFSLYEYSRSSRGWYKVTSLNQIGSNKTINVNSNKLGNIVFNYSSPEIHYALMVQNDQENRNRFVSMGGCTLSIGNYSSMSKDQYDNLIKGKKIYGKKQNTYEGCVNFLRIIDYGADQYLLNTICPDPFITEWGDITSSRGQLIKASEYFRLIAYEF